MAIPIRTEKEIVKLREACKLASDVLVMIEPYVKAGVTTGELDRICHEYMVNEQVVVVKKSKGVKNVTDLKDKVLGAQNGSSGYDTFNENPDVLKNIVKNNDATQYESLNEALIDLENDRIDALLIDRVYANYYLQQQNKLEDFDILNAGFDSEAFAVGARKADVTLVKKINEAFYEMYKEGKFQEISKKWFGEDVATEELKSK